MFSLRKLPFEEKSDAIDKCKEIPVDRLVDKKRIIGKNGWPRRRRGTRGR
jgi:hypothetical protein